MLTAKARQSMGKLNNGQLEELYQAKIEEVELIRLEM